MKHLSYISFLAAIALLASCGSSRNSTKKISGSEATRIEKNSAGTVQAKGVKSDNDRKVANALIKEAKTWLGVPYVYGGTTKDGTDCSGFMMSVFDKAANVKLPRDSRSQQSYCQPINAQQLQPGDLVFFSSKAGGTTVSHVGMFVGDNSIIHASTSRGVIISDLNENYYQSHYFSSGRVERITYAYTGHKATPDAVTPTPSPTPVAAPIPKIDEPQVAAVDMSVKKNREEKAPKPKHTTRGESNNPKQVAAAVPTCKSQTVDSASTEGPIVKVNGKRKAQASPIVSDQNKTQTEIKTTAEKAFNRTTRPKTTIVETDSILSGWMD